MTALLASHGASAAAGRAPVHVLHPGDVVFARRGERLDTLLGSCVSVILTDPRRTIAAMCHIVHVAWNGSQPSPDTAHADAAFDAMFRALVGAAVNPLMCEAYVFGGGNMFPAQFGRDHVGDRNSNEVCEMLLNLAIPIVECDIGGPRYRRVSWTVGPDRPLVVASAI